MYSRFVKVFIQTAKFSIQFTEVTLGLFEIPKSSKDYRGVGGGRGDVTPNGPALLNVTVAHL